MHATHETTIEVCALDAPSAGSSHKTNTPEDGAQRGETKVAMIGQTAMKGLTAYSPWFDRGGPSATFVCDVIAIEGSGQLDVDVEHKNYADTAATSAGTFTTMTAVGVSSKDIDGLKEQVRFKYTSGGTVNTEWVHFRMLNPSWRS